MPVHNSLLDLVGGTPLVQLHRLAEGIAARVLVKLEYLHRQRHNLVNAAVILLSRHTNLGLQLRR
jgi:cysteine synthase